MKEFEKECEKNEAERDYELEQENCISFLKGSKTATVTFSQGKYISKIEKLAVKFPDEVTIIHRNYHPSGNISSIVAHIPTSYIKINNSKRDLSEEERKAMGERLNNTFRREINNGVEG
jgi:hypothetical protein